MVVYSVSSESFADDRRDDKSLSTSITNVPQYFRRSHPRLLAPHGRGRLSRRIVNEGGGGENSFDGSLNFVFIYFFLPGRNIQTAYLTMDHNYGVKERYFFCRRKMC